MGSKNKPRNRSDDTDGDQDHLALRLIELLTDEQVLIKLKSILFPKDLKDMLDTLNSLTFTKYLATRAWRRHEQHLEWTYTNAKQTTRGKRGTD